MRARLLFAWAKKNEEDIRKGDIFGVNEKVRARRRDSALLQAYKKVDCRRFFLSAKFFYFFSKIFQKQGGIILEV